MKKKVYLHVGFHKTGTTAIQESFYRYSSEMEDLGINYATNSRRANHRDAWALRERAWGWKNRGGEMIPISVWEKKVKRIGSRKLNSLLSSEFFSELDDTQLNRMAADLKDYDVEVIFTIRPLAKILGSSYQQYLKYGIKVSYEEWLKDIFKNTETSKSTPTFWRRHRHDLVISRWAKAFGNHKIHLVVVDELEPALLYETFNKILQLPTGTLNAVEGKGSNRSLNFSEITLLLALNRAFPKDRDWKDYEMFVREGPIRALTNQAHLALLGEKLLTPQWALDESLKVSLKSVSKIDELGINIYGDTKKLLDTTVPVGVNVEVSDISIDTAVNALLAFDKSKVIRKFSTKEIFNESVKRLKRAIRKFLKIT
jgi:hypothetical protein